jgi:hypothetical protein
MAVCVVFFACASFEKSRVCVHALDPEGLIGHWDFDDAGAGTVADRSPAGNDGTVNGDPTWVEGVSGNALQLDGVDDFVEIANAPAFNGLTELTVTAWFCVNDFDVWEPVVNKGGFSEYTTDVFEVNLNAERFVHFVLNFQNAGRQGYNSPVDSISAGRWHHFVGTFNGDFVRIYVDGELVANYDAPNEPLKTSDASLQIGLEYDSPPESYFNGIIDDIYVFNRAITTVEAEEIFNFGEFSASESELRDNKAAERSVLGGVLDDEYVTVVATIASVFILLLWNLVGTTAVEFISDFTSEKITDAQSGDRPCENDKIGIVFRTSGYVIAHRYLAIVFAIIVFAVALSWTWARNLEDFFCLFFVNMLTVGGIFSVREWLRASYSRKHGLHTRHVFWPFGALLTIGSTLLGNTFSLASYTETEGDEETKKYGEMYFIMATAVYAIALVVFLLNAVYPSVLLQMLFLFAIMGTFIELLPIRPMNGRTIKKWRASVWAPLFVVVGITYVVMYFSLY